MSLYLLEKKVADREEAGKPTLVAQWRDVARRGGAQLADVQFSERDGQLYLVFETEDVSRLQKEAVALDPGIALHPIRLVGERASESESQPTYLVEWNLPTGLTMEDYVRRKQEKSPLYAKVPETTFLRTYVRQDMEKCLCFYAAPTEDAVCRARQAVGAPIDRLLPVESL